MKIAAANFLANARDLEEGDLFLFQDAFCIKVGNLFVVISPVTEKCAHKPGSYIGANGEHSKYLDETVILVDAEITIELKGRENVTHN